MLIFITININHKIFPDMFYKSYSDTSRLKVNRLNQDISSYYKPGIQADKTRHLGETSDCPIKDTKLRSLYIIELPTFPNISKFYFCPSTYKLISLRSYKSKPAAFSIFVVPGSCIVTLRNPQSDISFESDFPSYIH